MKSQFVTALSVVGVLGTATAAFAANTETLASLDANPVQAVAEVISDPAVDTSPQPIEATPAPSVSPSPTATDVPVSDPNTGLPVVSPDLNAPVAPAPVADGTTGGSGYRADVEDDDNDEEYEEYEEDHEDDD